MWVMVPEVTTRFIVDEPDEAEIFMLDHQRVTKYNKFRKYNILHQTDEMLT